MAGMEDGRVNIQDIIVYGRNESGQVGFFPTGYTPLFLQQAQASGIPVPAKLI
jgi:hypothetical protein